MAARVEFGRVELDSPGAQAIQQLRPTTVSWSNIVDYKTPATFHRLLRQVSHPPPASLGATAAAGGSSAPVPAVRHYLHSMNWPRAVKGTYFIDYTSAFQRHTMVERCLERWRTLAQSSPSLRRLVHLPPIDNRLNLCAWPLAQDFYKQWLLAFVSSERSGVPDLASHVRVLHPPYYTIFGRNTVTLGLEITYPPEAT